MIELVEENKCTGCGACSFVCPMDCIEMRENASGVILPVIDHTRCIECHKCQRTCPLLSPVTFKRPVKAYAAWSTDPEERRTSASGGIAAEIYYKAIADGEHIGGAVQNEDFSVSLHLQSDDAAIKKYKNSKYVFSSALDFYAEIKDALSKGIKCTVVGLPCQIAAIRKIFRDDSRLTLIDLVCHGTTPVKYLREHIKAVEQKCDKKADRMSFRDSEVADTTTFTFTLYKDDHCFYSEGEKTGQDLYNFYYHKHIGYRENCYNCPFAKSERVSDITLGDYKGLGKMAPCDIATSDKVSVVLVQTEKGTDLIGTLLESQSVVGQERPVDEPINADPQLQHPTEKDKYHRQFVNLMAKTGSFEYSVDRVYRSYLLDTKIRRFLRPIKRAIKRILGK